MDSYQREILDFLRSWGATHVRLEYNGGKHPKLCYDWRGEPQQPYVVAASSSDRLGATNAISDLKRRHPDGPVKPVARPRRKLSDMVPAVPFNPIPLAAVNLPSAGLLQEHLKETMASLSPVVEPGITGVGRTVGGLSDEWIAALKPSVEALPPIDRAFLKRLIDEMNRVVDETDWRFAKHPKTGRWRVFTVVE